MGGGTWFLLCILLCNALYAITFGYWYLLRVKSSSFTFVQSLLWTLLDCESIQCILLIFTLHRGGLTLTPPPTGPVDLNLERTGITFPKDIVYF